MSDLSKEYALALYEILNDRKTKEDVLYNLNELSSSLVGETKNFFLHPEIKKDEKKKMISSIYEDGVFKDFLYVLIDNNRFNLIDEIKDDFINLLSEEDNLLEVYVYSKNKLTKEYLETLKEKLKSKINKNITLINKIDNSITAGIRIVYESKEIDLTLDSKFNNFKEKLKESLWKE